MWLSRILYDVRAFIARRSIDEQLQSDIQYHLEREEQLHIESGATPDEARRIAAATFGGARQTREAALDIGSLAALDSVWRDIRYGVRSLRKRPVFTAAVVATLALGIGATTTVFTVVNAVLLRPLPFKDPGRLVAIWEHDQTRAQRDADHEEVAPANLLDWQNGSRVLAGVSTYGLQQISLTTGDETEEVSASAVTWSHFALLGVRPLIGRSFAPRDSEPGSEPVVVLSESIWRRRFGGDSGIVGRSILVGGADKTVAGVIPASAAFPRGTELWTPRTPTASQRTVRSSHFLRVIARLRPGVSVEQARLELSRVAERLAREYPESNAGRGVNVVGLQEDEAGSVRRPLLMLFGAVAFVMLVACANVAGLFIARSAVRAGELALRVTLGAGRRRIMQQLLAECLLLSAAGATIGVILAAWGTQLLMAASPADLAAVNGPISLDGRAVAFGVGLALAATLMFGVGPALAASKRNLYEVLKDVGRPSSGARQARGRRILVIGELALTTVLLVGAGLMVRSLVQLQRVDLGFGSSRLLTAQVHLPGVRYPGGTNRSEEFYRQLLQTLKQDPNVESASAVFMLPFANDNRIYSFRRIEERPTQQPAANFRVAMPGYFSTIQVPLLSGRDFLPTDTGAPPVVVINQTMARRFWPDENALGKKIVIRSAPVASEVIGIVGDMKYFGHDAPPAPEMYIPHAQAPMNDMTVVLRTRGEPAAVAGAVARAVRTLDTQVPLGRVSTMTQLVDESLAVRRFTRMLLTGFAVVGLLLSGIGLYGLIAYSVAQRTHEIGVRMALGATAKDVLALVAGGGVRLALTGVVIGAAASLLLGRALGTLLFGVRIADPVVLVTSATVLLLAAIVAMVVPTVKAAHVNPVISLRG